MQLPRASTLLLFLMFAMGLRGGERVVHPLVPGFRVEEVPVQLSNVNNLRFSPEGVLTALGYDGRIHLLRDTDGDGMEDRAELFWDQPRLLNPLGMHWASNGLYVSSHGKISFFPDANEDGKADREVIVTQDVAGLGVPENVDLTSVTLDKEGNIYFGIVSRRDAAGLLMGTEPLQDNARNISGTIQKIEAGTGAMEIIARGVRLPVALRFNRHDDLLMLNQGGRSADDSMLDVVGQVVAGRFYGFPTRGPGSQQIIVSEPPVVTLGPQRQNVSGLVFNEIRTGQKIFGPPSWEEDAFVTGFSGGKIWRVSLVKTRFGYLGKANLFARLRMLPSDVAISPAGNLYISCHGGEPDSGTGPTGAGKIFRITYERTQVPQPVLAWASSSNEVRVAFDRPVDESLTNRVEAMVIEFGRSVRPADRLEVLKSDPAPTEDQEGALREALPVMQAGLSEDRRTLKLSTGLHSQAVYHALHLPGIKAAGNEAMEEAVDLGYELLGVEAMWRPGATTQPEWQGELPHLNWEFSQVLMLGSAQHQNLQALVNSHGLMRLRTRLIPLQGAERIRFERSGAFLVRWQEEILHSQEMAATHYLEIPMGKGGFLEVEYGTGEPASMDLEVAYASARDPQWRVLPAESLMLPWAPDPPSIRKD